MLTLSHPHPHASPSLLHSSHFYPYSFCPHLTLHYLFTIASCPPSPTYHLTTSHPKPSLPSLPFSLPSPPFSFTIIGYRLLNHVSVLSCNDKSTIYFLTRYCGMITSLAHYGKHPVSCSAAGTNTRQPPAESYAKHTSKLVSYAPSKFTDDNYQEVFAMIQKLGALATISHTCTHAHTHPHSRNPPPICLPR